MSKTQFSELMSSLLQEISNTNLKLEVFFSSFIDNSLSRQKFEEIINPINNIKKILTQLTNSKVIILTDQDYAYFCMLLLYGSLMAKSLRKTKITQEARGYALSWKAFEGRFKSFLERDYITSSA
ncbi:MAG: hypothetical protein JSR33_04285 [Proteobacteria bacterium]|nr:hypothetical protein [Pseudomonadota bacterium]